MEALLVMLLNHFTRRPVSEETKRDPEDFTIRLGSTPEALGSPAPEAERLLSSELDRHLYCLGRSGSGKSRSTELLMRRHIRLRKGFGLVDPHGDLCESVIAYAYEQHRKGDLTAEDLQRLILIEPFRDDNAIGLNPLDPGGGPLYPHIGELVGIFRRIWSSSWGPRLEEVLRNTLLALALVGGTLVDVPSFLTNKQYRDATLGQIRDDAVIDYWRGRFDRMSEPVQLAVTEPVLNKVTAFLADPRLRALLGATSNTLNLRRVMDSGGQLLLNCSKGQLRDASALLGSFLVAQIQSAALSRADIPASERRPWMLVADEFQNFSGEDFESILCESRKYRLRLVVAHQHLAQLDPQLASAILGNVATRILFAVSSADAAYLLKNLDGVTLTPTELTGLPIQHALVWRQGKGGRVIKIAPVDTPDVDRDELFAFASRIRSRATSYAALDTPVSRRGIEPQIHRTDFSAPELVRSRPAIKEACDD